MTIATDNLYRKLEQTPVSVLTVDGLIGGDLFFVSSAELLSAMIPVLPLPDNGVIYKPIYIPQWANEADSRQNDCGPTCVAMHLRSRGDNTPVNALRTADPTGLTNAPQLQTILRDHGLASTIEQTAPTLPLTAIAPYSILLVNYDPLRAYAQDRNFRGWHWLVIVGPDPANPLNTLTYDPDYWGSRISEGNLKSYPTAALRSAFRPYSVGELCTSLRVDDVPLSVQPPQPFDVIVTTAPGSSLNIRTGPGTNFPAVNALRSGARVSVTEAQNGWLKIADKQFISAAWTRRV